MKPVRIPSCRRKGGYSLLEVILSMTILSVIVYSVFIVFDRTMQAMDEIFVGTHQYEQVRRFFDQIGKELVSVMVSKSDGTQHYFRGGPHWVEFSTPLLGEISEIDYIRKGADTLIAEQTKVHYYCARLKNYDYTQNVNRNIHLLFQHHLFRLVPENNDHQNVLAELQLTDPVTIKAPPATYAEVPTWLDDYYHYLQTRVPENLHSDDPAAKDKLDQYVMLDEMLSCRALQFRYYYEVTDTGGAVHEYSQDWWDSRLRYPGSTIAGSDAARMGLMYTNADYADYDPVEEERGRRYGDDSTGGNDDYTWDENWLYENEDLDVFRAFEGDTYNDALPVLGAGSFDTDLVACTSENDPWFQKAPSMVEVRVYIFDKTREPIPISFSTLVDDDSDWNSVLSGTPEERGEKLENAYRGEFFTIKFYLRTKSDSVMTFYRDLIIE